MLNPQHAEVLNMQGKLYERLNDHDRAIRAYTESLDIEVNPDVLLARGKIYFQLKKLDFFKIRMKMFESVEK